MKSIVPILTTSLLSIIISLASANSHASGDIIKGEATLKQNQCASCHGANFVKSTDDSIPSLAGQHQDYLVQALKQYRAGSHKKAMLARNNAVMMGNASKLSNEDIDNIAAYLSQLKGQLSIKK